MRQLAVLLSLAAPCVAILTKKIDEEIKPGCYRNGVFTGMNPADVSKVQTLAFHEPYQKEDKKGNVEVLQVNATVSFDEASCPINDRRVFLRAVGHSYHGTTALSQLVMSSSRVATLCRAETWQCEGGKFLWTGRLQVFSKLELYDRIWDLRQPVLFEKWAITNSDARDVMTEVENGVEGLSTPTDNMKAAGIQGLDTAFVIMWRPLCLMGLSSHNHESHTEQVRRDILGYAQLLRLYHSLVNASVPVMVMSYGDLVFNQKVIESQMHKFVPCLGRLNSDYKVKQGEDVFECNMWKAGTSIQEFGQSLDAEKMGYDIDSGACNDEKQDDFADELLSLSRKWE